MRRRDPVRLIYDLVEGLEFVGAVGDNTDGNPGLLALAQVVGPERYMRLLGQIGRLKMPRCGRGGRGWVVHSGGLW